MCLLAAVSAGAEGQKPGFNAAGAVDISSDWRVRADPRNAGLKARWDGISLNDGRWALASATESLAAAMQSPAPAASEARGRSEADRMASKARGRSEADRMASKARGRSEADRMASKARQLPTLATWLRKWIELPDPWSRVFIVIPCAGSYRTDLFVNGSLAARDQEKPHPGTGFVVRDITALVAGRTRFLLTLRVTCAGKPVEYGPVMLAREARPLLPGDDAWFDYLARQYPQQPWPSWLRGLPCGWVTTGVPPEPPWHTPAGPALAVGQREPPASEARGRSETDREASFARPKANAYLGTQVPLTRLAPLAPAPGGIFGTRGQIVPDGGRCAVSCWLYDPAAGTFHAPESITCMTSLTDRILPLPAVSARAGRFNLYLRLWPHEVVERGSTTANAGIDTGSEDSLPNAGLAGALVGIGEVTIQNITDQTRDADLFVAIHGFGPVPGVLRIGTVSYDRPTQTILADGRPVVLLTGVPDGFGATGFAEPGTVARFCASGRLPPEQAATDPAGLASGAAVYHLKIQPYGERTQTFRVFLAGAPAAVTPESALAIRGIGRKSSFAESRRAWQRIIGGRDVPMIRVPDMRAQDAFYASLAHLGVGVSRGFAAATSPEVAAALACAGLGSSTWDAGGMLDLPPANSELRSLPASGEFDSPPVRDGTFRPAEGLAVALSALEAGDPAPAGRMLAWCLAHSPAPGCFAWAEMMDPATCGWAGGDLPDARASALYVLLLRNMLLREEGDGLLLTPGLPEEWIRPGCRVEIRQAPTRFGRLPGISLLCSPRGLMMRILPPSTPRRRGRSSAAEPAGPPYAPPGGIRWRVPGARRIRQIAVNGVRLKEVPADRMIVLPPGKAVASVLW